MTFKNKKILVTGITSGLGKYIHNNIPNSIGLTRENRHQLLDGDYDLIIHCAFSNERMESIDDYYEFIDGSILLTDDLVKVKHKKFIYISSLEVYNKPFTGYRFGKLCSEAIVNKKANNPLMLRIPAMLGVDIRKNTVMKMLLDDKPKLTLSSDSTFNYILHSDLLNFISESEDKTGILNFISDGNITLKKVNEIFNGNPIWGDYTYITKEVDGIKLKTSEKVVTEFKKLIKDSV
tara:strand:- start:4427 stop:5131 length:705 start_codon:yes stop_codon:yes gene_type:complete